jgi:hypothetical protein
MNKKFMSKYLKIIAPICMAAVLGLIVFLAAGMSSVENPANNVLDDNPNAGKTYALLYNQGQLYENIKSNDQNLELIQEDLALFARATRPEFADKNILLGFTFDDDFEQNDDTFTHTGKFYGLNDKIKLTVTVLEGGVLTLSITNEEDGTNIDNRLGLNGADNKFITSLPVETDRYSLRYFNSENSILVVFYLGYTLDDVSEVEKILIENLGENYSDNTVTFNVNSVGRFSLQGVKDFANNPNNTPITN